MSWLNRDWNYLNASTHADASAFRRRMQARIRAAEAQRKAEEARPQATVRPIKRAKA